MPKTTKFDRQDVIDKATNLYWKQGYHATSMRSLQEEIDMRPGSIYAAFGSKDGLFKEALKNYAEMAVQQIKEYRAAHASPLKALIAFVKYHVIESQISAPNGMCMLSKTISELTEDNQELTDLTKGYLAQVAEAIEELISECQKQSLLNQTKTAKTLAVHLQVQIAGLRSFAKVNLDKATLDQMIDEMFKHYPF